MSDTSSDDRLTDEQLASIRTFWHNLTDELENNHIRYSSVAAARDDTDALLAEVERLRAALTHIIERYEQTQAGSHGDEALLPLDHWNLPRAMQQEARDALGLPAMSEETTR